MTKQKFPSEKLDQYMLRFPDGMRDRLKKLAEKNRRSMNAEIISALEEWLSEADYREAQFEDFIKNPPDFPKDGDEIVDGSFNDDIGSMMIVTGDDLERAIERTTKNMSETIRREMLKLFKPDTP